MYCPKCGKELSDDSRFCRYCGSQIQTEISNREVSVNHNTVTVHTTKVESSDLDIGYFCPNCKSRKLQLISETDTSSTTSGGGYSGGKGCLGYLLLGPIGLLCGACGSQSKTVTANSTRRFWVCQDCGNKFRMPDEIRQEEEQSRKLIRVYKALLAFSVAALFLLLMIEIILTHFELWWADAAVVIDMILSAVYCNKEKHRAEKLEQEYEYIMANCRKTPASENRNFWG